MTSRLTRIFSCLFSPALLLHPLTADAQTGTFSATGSMITPQARGIGAIATLLPNGTVLFAGGYTGGYDGFPLASAELYDPTTGTFTATGSMITARYNFTATLLSNGQVLVAGGDANSYQILASAELYDPKKGTFSATGSMTTARYGPTSVLLSNGQVLVVGGEGGCGSNLASAELYDPTTGTFTATGSPTTGWYMPMVTLLVNGDVLVQGGDVGIACYYSGASARADLYDPTTGTFRATGPMTTARWDDTATLLPNGQVLVAGGDGGSVFLSSAELYDPTTGTFSATGSMSTVRSGDTATLLANGKVLVAGGNGGAPNVSHVPLVSAELYDPKTGTFSLTGSMVTPQEGATATLLANGEVLVAGGSNFSGYLVFAELYSLGVRLRSPQRLHGTRRQ